MRLVNKVLGLCIFSSAIPFQGLSAATNTISIDTLQEQLNKQQKQINVLADALEKANASGNQSNSSSKARLSGYAEIHYNNLENQLNDKDTKSIDIHRLVLDVSYQFSDDLIFFSELEVEHGVAGEGKKGEVEIEQAFIQWQYLQTHNLQAGVLLIPAGMINVTHEPNTFYGVERNNVEKQIIPTTWWEAGIAETGRIGNAISYQALITSGLKLEAGEYKIRAGRQKASKADASELAFTYAMQYRGITGLTIGATLQHQVDLLQGETVNNAQDVSANLISTHIDYQRGSIRLRALYAVWDIDSNIELLDANAAGADEQAGFYIEPSYKISEKLGLFARYSDWDNNAGSSSDSEYQQFDIGANYWLHKNVALKIDVQNQNSPDGEKELDGFNLGVGLSY